MTKFDSREKIQWARLAGSCHRENSILYIVPPTPAYGTADDLNAAIAQGDVGGYLTHNYRFHAMIYDTADAPIMAVPRTGARINLVHAAMYYPAHR